MTKRRPKARFVEMLNMTGFVILIGIFAFATYSDIMRLKASHDSKKARAEESQLANTTSESANIKQEAKYK